MSSLMSESVWRSNLAEPSRTHLCTASSFWDPFWFRSSKPKIYPNNINQYLEKYTVSVTQTGLFMLIREIIAVYIRKLVT
jgi:hypothetical protein